MSNYCYKLNAAASPPDAHLLYVGEAKFENDWNSTPHTHNFMEFFFILSGEGSFTINNDTFPIQENDLILLNADIVHAEYSSRQNPLSYIVLGGDSLEFQSIGNEEYMIHHFTTPPRKMRCFTISRPFSTKCAMRNPTTRLYVSICSVP